MRLFEIQGCRSLARFTDAFVQIRFRIICRDSHGFLGFADSMDINKRARF